MHIEIILLLLTIGCIGGFLSGLLGIGGGIIFVPAIYFTLKGFGIHEEYIMHIAIASSLTLVFATGFVSAYHHNKQGSVDMRIVKIWAPYIVGGVIFGAFLASKINGHILKEIFSILLFLLAMNMAFQKEKLKKNIKKEISKYIISPFCFVLGALSSMLGMGGSVLSIPMMTYTGIPLKKAIGTGSALTVAVAIPGIISYIVAGYPHMAELPKFSIGYINLIIVAQIIPASILTSPLGVKASHRLPKLLLQRIFALLLMILSVRMFMSL